jgi:hypothetical protein
MKNDTIFFHLATLTKDPCFQLKEAHAEAMRTTLCPGCAHTRPGVKAIDVWFQEDRAPRDKPMNFLYGCGIGLIHRQLLELLAPEDADRDLFLGRVHNRHGRECVDWRTFHGRRTVIIRGNKNAEYRTCEVCGRNIYHATGQSYLCPAPPADASIYGSNLGGLVVSIDVAERVKAKRWRKVAIEELPVLEPPPDGFGHLPYREAES